MKLVDVTNSYAHLVSKQLENTDANLVRVFSLGKTLTIFSTANTHIEIVLFNETRDIKPNEIQHVVSKLLNLDVDSPEIDIIRSNGLVEISMRVVPAKKVQTEKAI